LSQKNKKICVTYDKAQLNGAIGEVLFEDVGAKKLSLREIRVIELKLSQDFSRTSFIMTRFFCLELFQHQFLNLMMIIYFPINDC